MQYRLRTLLIVLAILPPLLAGVWWIVRDENRRNAVADLAAFAPALFVNLAGVVAIVFAFAYVGAFIARAITGK